MTCAMGCKPTGGYECDNYGHDTRKRALARYLVGRTIKTAEVKEANGSAWLQLTLDDGCIYVVGVTGNLHDEAYFYFETGKGGA